MNELQPRQEFLFDLILFNDSIKPSDILWFNDSADTPPKNQFLQPLLSLLRLSSGSLRGTVDLTVNQ